MTIDLEELSGNNFDTVSANWTSQEKKPLESFELIEENEYKGSTAKRKNMISEEVMACECRFQMNSPRPLGQACGPESECINRLLYIECTSDCPAGIHCQNRQFTKKQYANVQVEETPGKGHGLFTKEPLKKGQFILEYVGEVLSHKAFLKRSKKYSAEGASHFYFMTLTQDEIIDASCKGNISRFMNHSCNPNCATQKWIVGGSMRIGLSAIRDIYAGAELTFDYKFESFGRSAQICRCGEDNCKGFIGTTSNKGSRELGDNEAEAEEFDENETVSSEESDVDIETSMISKRSKKSHSHKNIGILNSPDEVPKLLKQIMHAEKVDSLLRYIRILNSTENLICLRRVIHLHGLRILHAVLHQYHQNYEVVFQVLKLAKKVPIATKNTVVQSKLDQVFSALKESKDLKISALATSVLEQWEKLEMVYIIPKATEESMVNPQASEDTQLLSPNTMVLGLYSAISETLKNKQAHQNPTFNNRKNCENTEKKESFTPGFELASPTSSSEKPIIHMAPNGQALPPNWRYSFDSSGFIFYYNILTNHTQWEFPYEEASQVDKALLEQAQIIPAAPFKPDDTHVRETINLAKEKIRALQQEKETHEKLALLQKQNLARLKESISDTVTRYLSKYKLQIEHDHFKKLARKLTHTLIEKEIRSRESHKKPLDTIDENSKRKIKIYLKDYLYKLGYKKPDPILNNNNSHKDSEKDD